MDADLKEKMAPLLPSAFDDSEIRKRNENIFSKLNELETKLTSRLERFKHSN